MLLLFLSILLIIVGTVRFKVHPFLVLFVVALAYGLLAGMPVELVLQSVKDGFGGILGNIGLVIVMGVIIGAFLEHTGGAQALASKVLSVIGEKRLHSAMGLIGYIVSIPVFCDSGFIILHPLNKALSRKAGKRLAGTAIALALGLLASHAMVPPTPGPIAAAGIIGANLGLVILAGLGVSLVALIPAIFFAKWYAARVSLPIDEEAPQIEEQEQDIPPAWKAFLPIGVPILLIVLKSLNDHFSFLRSGPAADVVNLLGTPVIALLVGLGFALLLPKKLEKHMLSGSGWVGEALKSAAVILMVTGAGGIFGKMLQNSGLGDVISQHLQGVSLGILLPFIVAAALKTAQGSSTVAMITTASVVAPLLPALGLDSDLSKALSVVAIGAGSLVVSHANDSFFWVVTQMTGMDVGKGYRLHTLGTAVLGLSAAIVVLVSWWMLG